MSFDIPGLHIPDNSPEAFAVENVMHREHVGPEEAVRLILRNADKRNPAQRMIGLFSSDEDAMLMDEIMELVADSREMQTTRDIGL